MEKAILKTLIYADIFDYPLKAYEIHKWLIKKKSTLIQVEKGLERLIKKGKIQKFKYHYFLKNKQRLVLKRERKKDQSRKYFRKAIIFAQSLKLIPWIKLVGVSGGLALNNASKVDDIDLFIITSKSRIWLARIFAIAILDFLGVRRKPEMTKSKASGKLCLNIFLDEEKLGQVNKDIFIAHEVLQMKVLWQRNGLYEKYLIDNEWAFKFLPNWIGPQYTPPMKSENKLPREQASPVMTIVENLVKWLQLKIMIKPQGMERIEEGGLYFHPQDYRQTILKEYHKKITSL